jgi:hypothetical protein
VVSIAILMSLASSASLLTLPVSSAMSFLSTRRAHLLHTALLPIQMHGMRICADPVHQLCVQEGASMDITDRIRYARCALDAEQTERQRIAEADNEELQRAASVRLATRQAVREALDDILAEPSSPAEPS